MADGSSTGIRRLIDRYPTVGTRSWPVFCWTMAISEQPFPLQAFLPSLYKHPSEFGVAEAFVSGSDPPRTGSDPVGPSRTQSDPVGPSRTQSDPVGPSWTQLDPPQDPVGCACDATSDPPGPTKMPIFYFVGPVVRDQSGLNFQRSTEMYATPPCHFSAGKFNASARGELSHRQERVSQMGMDCQFLLRLG